MRNLTRANFPSGRPAVVVASPPCTEFSKADNPGIWPKHLVRPELSCVHAAQRIAAELGAPLILENVRGLQQFLGPAVGHYGSFYLWGDVPAILPHCPRWTKLKGASTPALRAMIPAPLAAFIAAHFHPSNLPARPAIPQPIHA